MYVCSSIHQPTHPSIHNYLHLPSKIIVILYNYSRQFYHLSIPSINVFLIIIYLSSTHQLSIYLSIIYLSIIYVFQVAFPWIQLGFVGLLDVEQVLCLWDRIVGYMDLMLLPVAAVAIFLDRAEPLLRVSCYCYSVNIIVMLLLLYCCTSSVCK